MILPSELTRYCSRSLLIGSSSGWSSRSMKESSGKSDLTVINFSSEASFSYRGLSFVSHRCVPIRLSAYLRLQKASEQQQKSQIVSQNGFSASSLSFSLTQVSLRRTFPSLFICSAVLRGRFDLAMCSSVKLFQSPGCVFCTGLSRMYSFIG